MGDLLKELGGASMGLMFFSIMVLGFVRRKAGNVVARGQYPNLARKLGMKYTPSEYKSGVGRLDGKFRGFRTTIDPDDQRRIHLRFNGQPAVELHSYAHNKRSGQGQRPFRPASRALSGQFKTAHASPEIAELINDSEVLAEQVKPLKFLRQLKTLSVTSHGVTAIFDFGNPPFIPAAIVEDVLPRLAAIAEAIEPHRAPMDVAEGSGAEANVAEANGAETGDPGDFDRQPGLESRVRCK